ncbi:MAG: family 78 glycoside hydrolase catalytic domain [Desulfobacterales bacterium]
MDSGVGDAWDSGRVESPDMVNIPYEGIPLGSDCRYYFRVRWWDGNGNESPFSDVSTFETALLEEEDWVAAWISMADAGTFPSRINTMVNGLREDSPQYFGIYLRHEFSPGNSVKRARIFVSGLGFYELRLNGQKVGNRLMDPAQTDYREIALYSTYDATDLLKEGTNAIGLLLGNGRHIEAYGFEKPRGIVQLAIEYADGQKDLIVSSDQWLASHGPLMENGLYYGECYDGRKEMTGWDEPGFDASAWHRAESVSGPGLASQTMPPIRATDTLRAGSLTRPKPGVYVFDFRQNLTGWARLFVSGPAGTTVTLRFAELLDDKGMLSLATLGGAEVTDTYTLKGGSEEVFEPRFTYHGFRYAEITGFPGVPAIENLEAIFIHSDVSKVGDFHCSNSLVNKIHRNTLWGQLSNLMSVPTDCPQRGERMGWMGDAQLAAEESFYNFDMIRFYEKYLNDIRFAQKDDGSLSDVVPPYWPLYPADPAWGSAYITIAWFCYFFCADKRIIEDHFDTMKRYIDFLAASADGYIIKTLGKYSDWCPPGSVVPKSTPVELTSTWYFYNDTLLLSRMAGILGKRKDSQSLSDLGDKIKSAFNETFLEGSRYATIQNGPLTRGSAGQTSQALPLYLDMVPEDKKKNALRRLVDAVVRVNDSHVDTGIVGTRYLFDVLTTNGHAETAYRVATQRTYPGWGYMIEEGATTLWERWESLAGGGMNSHNHIMLGSIDAWFYRTIAGLSPLEAGWKSVCIRPYLMGDLTHATASVKTVRGKVHVSWEKGDEGLRLAVFLPVGCRGEVHIPVSGPDVALLETGAVIWENGKVLGETQGVSTVDMGTDSLCVTIGSGHYTFELR